MSNPSLQEQLQALVPNSKPAAVKDNRPKKDGSKKQELRKPTAQKPAWLEYVYYGIELLKAHYPLCFKELNEIKPLKVGIKQDLVKHLGTREDIGINDKACMIKSLSYYVTTMHYFKNVSAGATRIDLDGTAAGTVSAEEATYSAEQYQAKLEKKNARTRPSPKA